MEALEVMEDRSDGRQKWWKIEVMEDINDGR